MVRRIPGSPVLRRSAEPDAALRSRSSSKTPATARGQRDPLPANWSRLQASSETSTEGRSRGPTVVAQGTRAALARQELLRQLAGTGIDAARAAAGDAGRAR